MKLRFIRHFSTPTDVCKRPTAAQYLSRATGSLPQSSAVARLSVPSYECGFALYMWFYSPVLSTVILSTKCPCQSLSYVAETVMYSSIVTSQISYSQLTEFPKSCKYIASCSTTSKSWQLAWLIQSLWIVGSPKTLSSKVSLSCFSAIQISCPRFYIQPLMRRSMSYLKISLNQLESFSAKKSIKRPWSYRVSTDTNARRTLSLP